MKCDVFLVGDAFHTRPYHVPRVLTQYARAAEAGGFDAAWIAEHHFIRYGGCPSVPVLAAHILAATTTLRVGAAACVLSQRHPVALGEEAVMLDGLSNGRFLLGVARGGPWVDLEVFGTGQKRFEHGFDASLDVLCDWLYGDAPVSSSSEFFQFRPVPVLARPGEGFGVWIAATSPPTVEIAARRGLPLLLGVHTSDDEKAALVRHYRDVARASGHDPDAIEHAAVYLACAADTARQARQRLRASMVDWLSHGVGDYRRLDGTGGNRQQDAYVDYLMERQLVGPPQQAPQRLRAAAEKTGISRALLLVEGLETPAEVCENIAAFGEALSPPPLEFALR